MASKTTTNILGRFYSSNVGVILVEGIPNEEYLDVVGEIGEQFLKLEKPLSKDFLELLLDDKWSLFEGLKETKNHLVYNFDLFGERVEPNKATEIMGCMRSVKNMGDGVRQLMVARPNANLDYNSRKGFGYHDNHPLGNWCEFFRIEDGSLVSKHYPIEHR